MATYNITAFAPTDAVNLTTPGPAGAFPTTGDEYRLRPDWSNSTHALTITVTDDDGTLGGDPAESAGEDTSQQTAVVTDAGGATIASGFAFAEYAFVVEGPGGQTLTVYSIYVDNTLVGYGADGPVQPGANYLVTSSYQPNGGLAPSYASFDPQSYEQAPDNTISGTDRRDDLDGGDGSDTIAAGGGDDALRGGAGADSLDGGGGSDTITGGAGDDTITTGAGDDLVVLDRFGGNDTITDFDIGDTDGDGASNDQLDVSDLRDLDGNPVNVWDVVVSDDGFGNALLTFPEGETLVLQGISPAQATAQQMVASGIPCFARGTRIDTPEGPRAVENLLPGDMVTTLDHGPQPIRWVRRGNQPLEGAAPHAKPVLISAGALGRHLPLQDLVVSPQHRILVGGHGQLRDWFEAEVLSAAKALTRLKGIRHMNGRTEITWVHLAFDRHEIVTANGCLTESLLLAPMVVDALTGAERQALLSLFGSEAAPGAALNGPPARPCLKVGEVRRRIAARLILSRESDAA